MQIILAQGKTAKRKAMQSRVRQWRAAERKARRGRAGQVGVWQGSPKQGRAVKKAEQRNTGQGSAGQGGAAQGRAEHGRARQIMTWPARVAKKGSRQGETEVRANEANFVGAKSVEKPSDVY